MSPARDELLSAIQAVETLLLKKAESGEGWFSQLQGARAAVERAADALGEPLATSSESRLNRLIRGLQTLRADADPRVCKALGREALALRANLDQSDSAITARSPRIKPKPAGESGSQRESQAITARAKRNKPKAPQSSQDIIYEDFSLERARRRRRRSSRRQRVVDEPEWSLVRTRESSRLAKRPGLSWRWVASAAALFGGAGLVLLLLSLIAPPVKQPTPSANGDSPPHQQDQADPSKPSAAEDQAAGEAAQGVQVFLSPAPGALVQGLTAARDTSAFHYLDALDARYGRQDGRARMEQVLQGVVSADAAWRKSGQLRALLSALRKDSGLILYQQSEELLPSEVMHAQGGGALPLGLTWFVLARRLGLSVDAFAQPGRLERGVYPLLRSGAPFWGQVVEVEDAPSVQPAELVDLIAESVLRREVQHDAGELRADLLALIDVQAERIGEAQTQDIMLRYAGKLLQRAIGEESSDHAQAARELLLRLEPNQLADGDVLMALQVLGDQADPIWLQAAWNQHPDYLFALSGESLAERYLRALVKRRSGISEPDAAWLEQAEDLLSRAVQITPERLQSLRQLGGRAGVAQPELLLARARYAGGDASREVISVLCAQALADEQPVYALALLQVRLLDPTLELAQEDRVLMLHALVLALNAQAWEDAETLLKRALEQWPQEPVLLKLDAESLIASGRTEEGLRLLDRYTKAFAQDANALRRLRALRGE